MWRPGERRSGGLETWPALHGQWKALRTEVKDVVRSAKRKLGRIRCTRAMISSRLTRPAPFGNCSVGAHLAPAHHPLLTMSP